MGAVTLFLQDLFLKGLFLKGSFLKGILLSGWLFITVSSSSTMALAAAFGNPNGSGGTVYALGSEVINSTDANDFNLLYSSENLQQYNCNQSNCPTTSTKQSTSNIETRRYYDIKAKKWLYSEFYIFQASYRLGKPIEIQVSLDNGKRSWQDAYLVAKKYGHLFGYIPPALRKPTDSLTIHNFYNGLMGGNRNIIIFEKRGDQHIEQGSIEEALFHEATHNYFNDLIHSKAAGYYSLWKQAQTADPDSISYYAKSNDFEDIAESLIAYYAVKYKNDRIGDLQYQVVKSIPNRIQYFEELNLNLTHLPLPSLSYRYYQLSNVAHSQPLNVYQDYSENKHLLLHASPKLSSNLITSRNSSKWQIKPTGATRFEDSSRYRLRTKKDGQIKCLDIINGGRLDQYLHFKTCSEYSGQSYSINPQGNDTYTIIPLWQKNLLNTESPYLSCLSLSKDENEDFSADNVAVGKLLKIEKCDGSSRQLFTIKPL